MTVAARRATTERTVHALALLCRKAGDCPMFRSGVTTGAQSAGVLGQSWSATR